MNNLSFDSQKYFLGKLCDRQHNYSGTGKTLRRISSTNCLECEKEKSREYRKRHPDRCNQSTADWKKRNSDWVKSFQQRQRESGRSAANTRR